MSDLTRILDDEFVVQLLHYCDDDDKKRGASFLRVRGSDLRLTCPLRVGQACYFYQDENMCCDADDDTTTTNKKRRLRGWIDRLHRKRRRYDILQSATSSGSKVMYYNVRGIDVVPILPRKKRCGSRLGWSDVSML